MGACWLRVATAAPSPSTPPRSNARENHTATLLSNGQVLVAGGYKSSALDGAELYNPSTHVWSPTGSLVNARYFHTANLLTNREVLVAGGGNTVDIASAELYDPSTGIWSLTGPLATPRTDHTATLLATGQVLAAGGYDNSPPGGLASAELFGTVAPVPATPVWALLVLGVALVAIAASGAVLRRRHLPRDLSA
jgi:Kelch motif